MSLGQPACHWAFLYCHWGISYVTGPFSIVIRATRVSLGLSLLSLGQPRREPAPACAVGTALVSVGIAKTSSLEALAGLALVVLRVNFVFNTPFA